MTPSGHDPRLRADAAMARDAALARVGNARRWTILGAAGLSAGFAALVASSPPSKASTASSKRATATTTTTKRSTAATSTRSGQEPALPPLSDGSQLGLAGPSQGPGPSDNGGQSQPQVDPSQQQQDQSAAAAPAPSPQPGPVSGGS